jgi:hypothetical protein
MDLSHEKMTLLHGTVMFSLHLQMFYPEHHGNHRDSDTLAHNTTPSIPGTAFPP